MTKITVELEYEKYDVFGRTKCEASLDVYEDEIPLTDDIYVNRIAKAIRKLFTNKNYLNPCATFVWRDTNESYHKRKYTSRIFGFGGDWIDKVIWDDYCDPISKTQIRNVTKKDILELYMDCINRATGKEKEAV